MSFARAVSRAAAQGSRMCLTQLTPRLSMSITRTRFAAAAEAADKKSSEATDAKSSATDGKNASGANSTEKQAELNAKLKQLEELAAKNKELTAVAADFKDKYVRSLAEMENVRTRLRKEVDNAKEFSISSFSKDVLEVADQLSLALRNVEPHIPKNASESDSNAEATSQTSAVEKMSPAEALRNFAEGVQMTQATLNKILSKYGLTSFEAVRGAPFDPAQHQALYQVPTEDAKQHATVAECVKLGYTLRERVLRPAFVGVFKKA